ncbi:MAG: hypothetical protein COY58_01885 [Gammaproteobacteria bacterium CG_4_10_14_0_8_um_filter_38_16]|nr:MAG: hypothetical protein COY58_01885 [Gammaproteobacteria bacterium CG_4_10_14_0_8_um_filter_38_16]PJA04065.1 MAG: hypothetical protein COX72_01670 [Gammaproteobacteria bacterium CG_4_10_14_0_2_um_filter_38_22]PJB10983.1 MAG: hypothetical protein CO120_02015 [Gammaproteobacteria bacterium CG_4_9_14_3_um_filter_38_9]
MSLKEDIVKEIEHAFDGVTLSYGVSINQSKIIDDNGKGYAYTNAEFLKIPRGEITENWKEIPTLQLDDLQIAHLDALGFRYYIPALMIKLLDDYDKPSASVESEMVIIGTLSRLHPKKGDSWKAVMSLYSILTNEQRLAIAHFLKNLPMLVTLYSEDKKVVERAYKNYWAQFIP